MATSTARMCRRKEGLSVHASMRARASSKFGMP
jgi:hypothetical protein